MKKALIINSSPKPFGNTTKLINLFKENFEGSTKTIYLYPHLAEDKKGCQSCFDCGGCHKVKGCVVKDTFQEVLNDDYDIVVLAFPIFMSNAPAPIFNLISRFNFMYNNKKHLNIAHVLKPKKSALLMVAGGHGCAALQGESNIDLPLKQARYVLKKLNAPLLDENIVAALNTDTLAIEQNTQIALQIKELTQRL